MLLQKQNLYELSWEAITGRRLRPKEKGGDDRCQRGEEKLTVSPSPRKGAYRWKKTLTEVESFKAKAL